MKIDELIQKLEQTGQIQKKNLTYIPKNMNIKKWIIWRNPSPICTRWDADVWFNNGQHKRITSISNDTITLIAEIIKHDSIQG